MAKGNGMGIYAMILAGTIGLGASLLPRPNAPETYKGFESYSREGYAPVACQIPTKGDVVYVEKLAGKDYREIKNPDSSITVEGEFFYRIEPDIRFTPKAEHTDMYGHSPDTLGDRYWESTRKGKVTLKKLENILE